MEERQLGTEGPRVSRLGLGLAALGRPGYINLGHAEDFSDGRSPEEMEARTHQMLDQAWESGVRYFDAARSYGRAEEFLGSWLRLRQLPPTEVTVGSKWGYRYTAGWRIEADVHEVKEHSLPVLRRQIEETREHLGAYLDLYQIHSATLQSGVLENPEVLDELARLRDTGLRIGLSLSGAGQAQTLRRALEVERGGLPVFSVVQATWNLLERSAEDALREAHGRGMGVIVKEALANGRLTERNRDPEFTSGLERLRDEARRLATSVDALALAAVLARPWVDVVLSGASTPSQLRSNLDATSVAWDEAAEAALHPLVMAPDDYWSTRGDLRWN